MARASPNMVSMVQTTELDSSGTQSTAATTPLLATSPIPQHSLFPMTKWRPRTGLTMTQFKFKRDLHRLLAAFGLTPAALEEEPPQIYVNSRSRPNRRNATADDDTDDDATSVAAQTSQLTRWQRVNTAIYWHLVPAIEIDGTHYLEDTATIDSFVSGQLANGRGLARWACGFVDVSEFSAQLLLANELGTVKLAGDARLSQLLVHPSKMHQSIIGPPITERWAR